MVDVLVIDDDADIRSLLELALVLDGHRVTTASGGGEALAILSGPDRPPRPIVILDVQMPDLDGWEVLERIRAQPELDGIPVMLCTVRASAADLTRGWLAGCDAYVPKPFDLPALAAQVVHLANVPLAELLALRRTRAPAAER